MWVWNVDTGDALIGNVKTNTRAHFLIQNVSIFTCKGSIYDVINGTVDLKHRTITSITFGSIPLWELRIFAFLLPAEWQLRALFLCKLNIL